MSRLVSLPCREPQSDPLALIDANLAALARGTQLPTYERDGAAGGPNSTDRLEADTQALLSHQALKTLQELRDALTSRR